MATSFTHLCAAHDAPPEPPTLTATLDKGGKPRLILAGQAGQLYRVEVSSDLRQWRVLKLIEGAAELSMLLAATIDASAREMACLANRNALWDAPDALKPKAFNGTPQWRAYLEVGRHADENSG